MAWFIWFGLVCMDQWKSRGLYKSDIPVLPPAVIWTQYFLVNIFAEKPSQFQKCSRLHSRFTWNAEQACLDSWSHHANWNIPRMHKIMMGTLSWDKVYLRLLILSLKKPWKISWFMGVFTHQMKLSEFIMRNNGFRLFSTVCIPWVFKNRILFPSPNPSGFFVFFNEILCPNLKAKNGSFENREGTSMLMLHLAVG